MEMYGLRHKRLVGDSRPSSMGGSSQRSGADCVNSHRSSANRVDSQRVGTDCVNTQRISDNYVNPRVDAEGVNSQMSSGEEDSNDDTNASLAASVDPPRRGRKKRCRTELRMPPSTGKVQLEPKGSMQFSYVNYNPKGYKYGSQVGVIIKRLYPGVIEVRDEDGRVVAKRAAFSWNDYTWRKHETGISYARLVKREFWNLFTTSRQHMRKAARNLDTYLVKRVSDMMHQARLDAVKLHFDHKNENCDDTRARTILLTEAEYLECKLEWCPADAWRFLSRYWTSDEFLEKRRRAQESRLKSEEDVAQNRGGSRPWAKTQQFVEYKYGCEEAGTVNTYAVMKSGMRNVDSTGNSAPIPSRKAKNCLDNYKAGVGPDDISKELDGKVLYSMEGGLRHGRVPIGNGAVDKEAVLAVAKSKHVQISNTAAYQSVVEENEQLREKNDILSELVLRLYADIGKAPPADLLDRLANIDAHRHQGNGSSHAGSNPQDMENTNHVGDNDNNERSDGMHSDGGCNGMQCADGSSDMHAEDGGGGNQDMED